MSETKLHVELLEHTPNPEKLISACAKLCYSDASINNLLEKQTPEAVEKFLNKLTSSGHFSPIEHISFTFGIEGVSRSLTHQLVRHRIGCSYSQQSQRYVTLNQFEYIIPDDIKDIPEAKEEFIKAMEEDQQHYDNLTYILREKYIYEDLLTINEQYAEDYKNKLYLNNDSIPKDILKKVNSVAEKKAIENARYVFPNACSSKIITTMNFRALLNFCQHRACLRSQSEIRTLCIEMIKLVKPICPNLYKLLVPSCCSCGCAESSMSCGRAKEVKEFFKNI